MGRVMLLRRGFLCLLIVLSLQLSSQTYNIICFDIDSVQGVIFLEGGNRGLGKVVSERSTTNVEEVLHIDSLAKCFVDKRSAGRNLPQQGYESCPIILKSWKNYKRQIIKYIDQKTGDQILWFQYIHEQVISEHPDWKENWVLISGGCSNYWQIKYNLKSKRFFDFVIN